MICAVCLRDGRPLYPDLDDPEWREARPAAAAITVEHGTAYCLEHWRTDADA